MRRLSLVLIPVLSSLLLGLVVGCAQTQEDEVITKQQAIEIAVKVLLAKGWDPDRYNMTVTDEGDEWRIRFGGKDPCPPGDHIAIYVSKKDGSVFVIPGM